MGGLVLRYYQEDSLTNVMADKARGINRVIVALPTGTGKSAVQNNLVKRYYPIQKYRTMFVGGLNRALNHQATAGFKREYEDCRYPVQAPNGRPSGFVTRPGIGIVMGNESAPDARIVVASAQTITPSYLKDKTALENQKIQPEDVVLRDGGIFLAKGSKRRWMISARMDEILAFGQLHVWVHDECHHIVADGTHFVMLQLALIYQYLGLDPIHSVGFTATPMRNDERALANCYDRISYQMTYDTAVEQGFLSPLPNENVYYVQMMSEQGEEEMQAIVNWDEQIIKAYKEKATGRTAAAFVGPINGMGGVAASKFLAKKFNEAGITAVHVDGEYWIDEHDQMQSNNKRNILFERIMRGEIKVVCNFNVLVEGVDLPILDCLLLAKKVNEVTFTQMLGRVLRLFNGDPRYGLPPKKDAMVIDFTGQELVVMQLGTMTGIKVDPFKIKEEPKEDEDEADKILLPKSGNLRDMVPEGWVLGTDNMYHLAKIKRGSKHVWHIAQDNWMSMSIGEKNSLIITAPHYGTADTYMQLMNKEGLDSDTLEVLEILHNIYSNFTVWHIQNGEVKNGEAVRQSPNLDEIEQFAGQYAEECPEFEGTLSKKGQKWRSPSVPASEKQVNYMHSLRPDINTEGKTKSQIAEMITHELSRRAIQGLFDSAENFVKAAVR